MLHDDYLYVFLNHNKWLSSFADNVQGVCEGQTPNGERIFCPSDGISSVRSMWLLED